MKILVRSVLVVLALSTGIPAALADDVQLPCKEVEDCKPIDPCAINPDRCKPEPAPKPSPVPPLPSSD